MTDAGVWLCPALIQLMAAAEARRDVCYFTFKDPQFVDDLHDMHRFICDLQLTVGQRSFTDTQPRAGSGVVRMDPIRFLAACRTRRLNQG